MTFSPAIPRLTGHISRLDDFHGFICADVDGRDYFFYQHALESTGPQFATLRPFDQVVFTPITGDRNRPRAIEVRVTAQPRGDVQ